VIGIVAGIGGAVLAGGLFGLLKRSETAEPFKTADLVGDSAYVSVAIPAGRFGSVIVHVEGQTHEIAATSHQDVPAGRTVTITGIAGSGVIVREEAAAAAAAVPGEES
jgi:membrane protein implicated in regulation of membrane protease activity